MKQLLPIALAALTLASAPTTFAGEPEPPAMTKRTQEAVISSVLPFPAEQVWEAVAVDYGRIAESHPLIIRSDYRHGSLQGELGAERTCWFNAKGTRLLHEQIVDFDDEQMVMVNRVLEANGFPLDPDNTLGTYRIEPIDENSSRITMEMQFRAKPGVMTRPMVRQFEGLISDYFIALEHHLATGEAVTQDNFEAIAKKPG